MRNSVCWTWSPQLPFSLFGTFGLYFQRIGWRSMKCSFVGLLGSSEFTTENSNTSVSDNFFYTHIKILIFLWASQYTDRKIQKRIEKLHDFSVRDNSQTEKIYTHIKMLIFLTGFLKLTEKYYARTEKLHLFCGVI